MAAQNRSHDSPPAVDDKALLSDTDHNQQLPEIMTYEDSDSDGSGISLDDLPEFICVNLDDVRKDFTCPICLGIIQKTKTVMGCLDRFCTKCIEKAIGQGKNECPACGTHFAGHRSLRDDPNFDALIAILFRNVDKYEEEIQSSFSETSKPLASAKGMSGEDGGNAGESSFLETAKPLDSAKGMSGEDGGNAGE